MHASLGDFVCIALLLPFVLRFCQFFILDLFYFYLEHLVFVCFSMLSMTFSSGNRDSLISSFLFCMPFISISCLIVMVRTSSTMLNKSRENRHPCLALVLQSFIMKYNVSCSFVLDAVYLIEGVTLYFYFYSGFCRNECWISSSAFSILIDTIM